MPKLPASILWRNGMRKAVIKAWTSRTGLILTIISTRSFYDIHRLLICLGEQLFQGENRIATKVAIFA